MGCCGRFKGRPFAFGAMTSPPTKMFGHVVRSILEYHQLFERL